MVGILEVEGRFTYQTTRIQMAETDILEKICQEYENFMDLDGFDTNMPISSFKRKINNKLVTIFYLCGCTIVTYFQSYWWSLGI